MNEVRGGGRGGGGGPPLCHHLHHLQLHTRQKFQGPRCAAPVPHSDEIEDFPGLITLHANKLSC